MKKNKLIIYELNEVPEKVLFDFIEISKFYPKKDYF